MKIPRIPFLALVLLAAFPLLSTAADNWGQWRGPDATGAAPASAKPPIKWSEDKNVKWKVRIPGEGSSSPIVWGDKVFVQTAVKAEGAKKSAFNSATAASSDAEIFVQAPGQERRRRRPGGNRGGGGGGAPTDTYQFKILCLKRSNGDVLWEKTAAEVVPHEGHHQNHAYGSHTPVTDGEHVYAYFGTQGLYCYDFDGKLVWDKKLGKMTMRAGFGEGTSIALHGDKVIVNWDHEGPSFIAAFNKKTGDEIWRKDRDEGSTWGTPLVVEHGGKAQVVTNGKTAVRSYDVENGKLLWTSTGQTERPVATPVSDGEHLFVMSGFRGNMLSAIKLAEAKGDVSGKKAEFWTLDRHTPDIASPLLSNGRLYFTSGKGSYISCYEAATGKPLFVAERIDGFRDMYSSPGAANGHVYIIGRDGTTFVLKDADEMKVVAVNKLDDGIDGSPAFVDGELFLRGKNYLYCIAEEG